MFLGLPDPHPLVTSTGTDPAPDPSITKQKSKKNLDFYWFCDFFMTFFTSVSDPHQDPDP
jgi:hypothetical protein